MARYQAGQATLGYYVRCQSLQPLKKLPRSQFTTWSLLCHGSWVCELLLSSVLDDGARQYAIWRLRRTLSDLSYCCPMAGRHQHKVVISPSTKRAALDPAGVSLILSPLSELWVGGQCRPPWEIVCRRHVVAVSRRGIPVRPFDFSTSVLSLVRQF